MRYTFNIIIYHITIKIKRNDILKRDVDFEKQKVKELKEQNILKDLFIKEEGLKEKFEESKAILKQILEEQKQKILNKNKGIKR